jgi:hypothetical protein
LTKDIVGLKSITDELETKFEIYLKIFVMLYADDTILLAQSAEDLQVQLNAFGEYCDNWKMKVNVNKTKIVVTIAFCRILLKFGTLGVLA